MQKISARAFHVAHEISWNGIFLSYGNSQLKNELIFRLPQGDFLWPIIMMAHRWLQAPELAPIRDIIYHQV